MFFAFLGETFVPWCLGGGLSNARLVGTALILKIRINPHRKDARARRERKGKSLVFLVFLAKPLCLGVLVVDFSMRGWSVRH
ncbi:MAG: hypothetical protein JNM16_06365 [Dechloromonas sp.]|nr:hypothetical protein [Dechloromonas sp.]